MVENIEILTLPQDNILIIDLEATCSSDESITGSRMEIIEIGACWISPGGGLGSPNILGTFQSFVRPVVNRQLTSFCTELTGITQDQVDGAQPFSQVAPLLQDFALKYAGPASIWASWGAYDRVQFGHDSERHGVENPIAHLGHANLKKIFAKHRKIRRVGMMGALKVTGLGHSGSHHRALDDAINIARIMSTMR